VRKSSCLVFVHVWELSATSGGQKYQQIKKVFDRLMEKGYICVW